jgi:hypothetical protein
LLPTLTRRRQDGLSRLKKNRLRETASLHRRDLNGWTLTLPSPHIAADGLVPLIPAMAYRAVKVGVPTSECCTLAVREPGLSKVRIVGDVVAESLTRRQVVLVTNRVDWSTAKRITLYLQRRPTDTFAQDRTGHLGFQDYRWRSSEARRPPWC